jgi:predicted aspartyl protease
MVIETMVPHQVQPQMMDMDVNAVLKRNRVPKDQCMEFNATCKKLGICILCREYGHTEGSTCPNKGKLDSYLISSCQSASAFVVECLIANQPSKFLIDTGASVEALISSTHVETLGLKISYADAISLLSFTGQRISCHARCQATIAIQDIVSNVRFIAVPDLHTDVLLGLDWLKMHDIVLNCGTLLRS